MNDNIGKQKYDQIAIPEDLSAIVNNAIQSHEKESNKMRLFKNRKLAVTFTAAALLLSFTTTLNVNPAFAQSMSEVPFVGKIANVLTFVDHSYETEDISGDIKIVKIENLTDAKFEEKINSIIKEKTDMAIEKGNENIAEYKEAFLATGGTEESFSERDNKVKVDYTAFTKTDDTLSFMVYSYNSVAASTAEYDYYNIDLKLNKEISLSDLVGNDFVNVITESIKNDFAEQLKNEEISLFEGVGQDDWKIREDIDFYIDENENVVVVFDKYEIAAGANGRLEYVID
jgi:hypothetical protein